jgi:hypothetical protein
LGVVCNFSCPSSAQSFSGSSPTGFITFYCLRFETPPTWRGRSTYLYPQEQGVIVITPGTGFSFRRLLELAGRYNSAPPPHGLIYYMCVFVCVCIEGLGFHGNKVSRVYIRTYYATGERKLCGRLPIPHFHGNRMLNRQYASTNSFAVLVFWVCRSFPPTVEERKVFKEMLT